MNTCPDHGLALPCETCTADADRRQREFASKWNAEQDRIEQEAGRRRLELERAATWKYTRLLEAQELSRQERHRGASRAGADSRRGDTKADPALVRKAVDDLLRNFPGRSRHWACTQVVAKFGISVRTALRYTAPA